MPHERIVSPAVFTEEKDLSFLPQGIGEIGAAIVGPTVKGPAFVPTIIETQAEFEQIFGGTDLKMYVPYAVQSYLKSAGRVTVVRILGLDGYSLKHPLAIVATGSYGKRLVSFLHPTFVVSSTDATSLFQRSTLLSNISGSAVLKISGSFTTDTSEFTANATDNNGTSYSASINPSSPNYIGDLFGYNPEGMQPVYNYVNFKVAQSASLAAFPNTRLILESGSATPNWDFTNEYQEASTPWVTSQKVSGQSTQLFKIHSLSHGTATNYELKIAIINIKAAGTIAGSNYGSFTVVVRGVDQQLIPGSSFSYQDTDTRPTVFESFTCNLDPNSPNYIARVIGDKYLTVDADGRVVTNGNYPNKSKRVRVEMHDAVNAGAVSANLVPFGFEAPYSPIPTGFTKPMAVTYVTAQQVGGVYNKRKHWGFDYDFSGTDNLNYLKPLPVEAKLNTGSNAAFYLGDYNQDAGANFPTPATAYSGSIDLTSNTSIESRKFIIPMQGGFDGFKPNVQKKTGKFIDDTNTQGFNLTYGEGGNDAYRKGITAVSNPDEFDINMILAPGVLFQYHSDIATFIKDMCEDRSDTFYLMDNVGLEANVLTATDTVSGIDSNYIATYHPWVKIVDTGKNKPVWVPPSTVMCGVIAFSDKVSHEWFAPAGLNRGGITEAVDVYSRLNQSDRDDLYEGRVNPIAQFPGQGIVAWGQKTLQARPSALDRINVRRLLIALKKFIASSSRFLVFENNTSATRNRFLNIVNPFLESVQQRQGLYAFKVVMDESNNTPDVIDRNILYGQIYLQPAKTAEFIILDFNILPTGASFPE
jgi:hypothetical protein